LEILKITLYLFIYQGNYDGHNYSGLLVVKLKINDYKSLSGTVGLKKKREMKFDLM
jgi:hypothetical protein